MVENEEIESFADTIRKFLKDDVECHFNWKLEQLDVLKVLERFEAGLRDMDLIVDTPLLHKWALKLSYGYEKFKFNKKSGLDIVKEAINEMESTEECLFVRYKVAFRHSACSLLATMLLYTEGDTTQLHDLIQKITLLHYMPDNQRAGVFGLKANVLRLYGPDGTKGAIPVITEATRLCPSEFEWKISKVITFGRVRHFDYNLSITLEDVAEPMEILEELIRSKEVLADQKVVCKYFLARIHLDLIKMQKGDPKQKEKSEKELKRLSTEIHQSETTSPQIVSFCAQQLARNGQLSLGISMIQKALSVCPRHIGLNTTIGNLYKPARKFDLVQKHAKIAMDEGGYGAAWLYLECVEKSRILLNLDDFFSKLLSMHPSSYTAQTHVNASLFYYFSSSSKGNISNIHKGICHMNSALEADPSYEGIRDAFCKSIQKRVDPLEVTYNQICIYQRKLPRAPFEEMRKKISTHADVTRFVTSKDLVLELRDEFYRSGIAMHRQQNTNPRDDSIESGNKSWRQPATTSLNRIE